MKQLIVDGFEFNFSGIINAYRFDETARELPHYHGMSHCMKAVDLIIETNNDYYFVEVKNLKSSKHDYSEIKTHNKLVEVLKYKFRDSFIYRYAENKIDKTIHYLCLLELDKPLLTLFKKKLKQQLPVTVKTKRWERPLVKSVQVVDSESWNRHFANWRVKKI